MLEVANKETPTEQKPAYLLENRNAPSVDWDVIADFKQTWLELGGEEEALDIVLKHTRVVTPELKSQHLRGVIVRVSQLTEENPKQKITLIATGGRSGKQISKWFAQSQDPDVQKLKDNSNMDWRSLALGAEHGAQYANVAPDELYESDQKQTVCLIDDWGLSGEKLEARTRKLEEKISSQRVKNNLSALKYWVLVGGLSNRARRRIAAATDNKNQINIQATYTIPSVAEELEEPELEMVNTSLRKIYGTSWVEIDEGRYLILDWDRGAPDNFPHDFTPLGGLIDKNGDRHSLFKFLP
jgi:hypothetical protein